MGIDIYARWQQQSEQDKEAQVTGFSTISGNVGYLREAYHGGPYVTKLLVEEAFDHDRPDFDSDMGVPIEAKVLRERLPYAVVLALYREQKIYGNNQEPVGMFNLEQPKEDEKIMDALTRIFAMEVNDNSHRYMAANITEELIDAICIRIGKKDLPPVALSFVEFVELAERVERETESPISIYASY